jgi:soluble lytic murein transglycosylase-like protein
MADSASWRQQALARAQQARASSSRAARWALGACRNSLALVGLGAIGVLILAVQRPDLAHEAEVRAFGWLNERFEARELESGNLLGLVADPDAIQRATATPLDALPADQAAVTRWLARRYKVAPEPVGALVQEAWAVGQRTRLEPTLILAIMAAESSFNPFAQSPVGAQGLMQVMTRVHNDKYEHFGGTLAAFDPITNLRVGVQVLKESIRRSGGTVEGGLRYYVGAALLEHDGGYTQRVLTERDHLRRVAAGERVPVNAPRSLPLLRDADATPAADNPATADSATAAGTPADPPTDSPALAVEIARPVAAAAETASTQVALLR